MSPLTSCHLYFKSKCKVEQQPPPVLWSYTSSSSSAVLFLKTRHLEYEYNLDVTARMTQRTWTQQRRYEVETIPFIISCSQRRTFEKLSGNSLCSLLCTISSVNHDSSCSLPPRVTLCVSLSPPVFTFVLQTFCFDRTKVLFWAIYNQWFHQQIKNHHSLHIVWNVYQQRPFADSKIPI